MAKRNSQLRSTMGRSLSRVSKSSTNRSVTIDVTGAAPAVPAAAPEAAHSRRPRRHSDGYRLLCFVCFLLLLRDPLGNEVSQAEAFVTPKVQVQTKTLRTSTDTGNKNNKNSNSPSTTRLHFFSSILSQNQNGNNGNGKSGDLPLARYVDVSANYTLAHTPEDAIDLTENQRLVCVGDVHGDLDALKTFLEMGGVYDSSTDSWCGGNTIVVQCGDILDRGFEELACYQLLSRLSREAPAAGGKVILLVGNHETLNAMGLFQYAYTDLEHEKCIGAAVDGVLGAENKWRKQYVNNQPARWASYEPGGLLAHSLLRNMKVAVRVGNTLCVHAGLKPEHLKDNGGIEGMNAEFRDWISLGDDLGMDENANAGNKKKDFYNPVVYNHNGNYPPDNPRKAWIDAEQRQKFYVNSVPAFLQSGSTSPIWMRDYSSPPDAPPAAGPSLEADLDTTLALVGADRMVVGHTIQRRINGVLGGKAWRLDVGASRGCLGGTPEVLEVVCRRRDPDGPLVEDVSVLTPAVAAVPPPSEQALPAPEPQKPQRLRIPANERLVDSYTQAAVQLF